MSEKPKGWHPCAAHSPDGDQCILGDGHSGSHQRAPCNGTCDTCECDFADFRDCSVCGRLCVGDPGTAEEPVTVDGEIVCGECADEIAEAFDGEGHDRSSL